MSTASFLNQMGAKLLQLLGDFGTGSGPIPAKEVKEAHDQIFDKTPFAKLLPFRSYDSDSRLFFSQNSIGFVIECVPFIGAEESTQKELCNIFQEIMPEGSSVQCLLWADHRISPICDQWKNARAGSSPIYQVLAEKRAEYLKSGDPIKTRNFRTIISYSVPVEEGNEKLVDETKDVLRKLEGIINLANLARVWSEEDLLEVVSALVNFRRSPDSQKTEVNPYELLSSQIPSGGRIQVFDDRLSFQTEGETSLKTFRVSKYPSSWSFASMQQLIGDLFSKSYRLESPFFLHYGVYCPKQRAEQGSLRVKMELADKQANSPGILKMVPDLGEEIQEYNLVRKSLHEGGRLVLSQFSAGVWGEKDELTRLSEGMKSLFRRNHFMLSDNDNFHLPQFMSILPMTWSEYASAFQKMSVLKTTLATECGNLLPLQAEWKGTRSPGMILTGRRGQLATWSPFDSKGNYNVVVAGSSGSGKSVFMQELLISSLGTGARAFVLDVGRSFQKVCNIVNGQQIEFSTKSDICLNPFTHVPSDESGLRDASISMIKSILALMAAPKDDTTDLQDSLLEDAVRAVINEKGNEGSIDAVAKWLKEHKSAVANDLGTMLGSYTSAGAYGKFFNGKSNIEYTKPFVLIELEELKGMQELQAVVLQLFIINISDAVFLGDRTTPFIIMIDEAWDLLRSNQAVGFVETLARRLRKYNGSLVIGTQGLADFDSKPGARAAYDNSDWTCLLHHKSQDQGEGAASKLGEFKSRMLKSISHPSSLGSEVMIMDSGGGYAINTLSLDPYSSMLYSTTAKEFAAIQSLVDRGVDMNTALETLLKEKHGAA